MAIKILICDDEREEVEKIQQMLTLYSEKAMLPFDVESCSTPKEIKEKFQNSEQFDIIFLDIYIDRLNGIDLARGVRHDNIESKIVFISTSNLHAMEAFDVNAFQYLVKPVSYNKFSHMMDSLLKEKLGKQFLSLSAGSTLIKVYLQDFVYAETLRNYQEICFSNGTKERFKINGTVLFEMLAEQKRFVRVGASYIVNLDYVLRITIDAVELNGGYTIHIPRRALPGLKRQYFDYYCGNVEGEP